MYLLCSGRSRRGLCAYVWVFNRHHLKSVVVQANLTPESVQCPAHMLMGAGISNRCRRRCSHAACPRTCVFSALHPFLITCAQSPTHLAMCSLFCGEPRKRVPWVEPFLVPSNQGKLETEDSSVHASALSCWDLITEESHSQLWLSSQPYQGQLCVLGQHVYDFTETIAIL